MVEFKIGDLVRCKPGFSPNGDNLKREGGMGYIENKEFIVSDISNNHLENKNKWVYWREEGGGGVFGIALELVNKPQYQIW